MGDFLPCQPVSPADCPETFSLRVSGWIDATNIGDHDLARRPPAGLRLRWNCPFLVAVPGGAGSRYPSRFKVMRSNNLSDGDLFRPVPNCGHVPRTIAPAAVWKRAIRLTPGVYAAGPAPCDSAAAVYFELHPTARPVTAVISDAHGTGRVAVALRPGARFYLEMAGLHAVTFSESPALSAPVRLLQLQRSLSQLDIATQRIATVDARVWPTLELDRVAERLMNLGGESFVTLDKVDWLSLCQHGNTAMAACDAHDVIGQTTLGALNLSAAARWEAALLMGWGFLDGEHPPGSGIDDIVSAAMTTAPSNAIFAYQVLAEFDMPDGAPPEVVESTPFFVRARPEAVLSTPNARIAVPPVAELITCSQIAPGPAPDQPLNGGHIDDCVQCRVSYLVETDNVANERIQMQPLATPSIATGEAFNPIGVIGPGPNDPPTAIDGMFATSERRFDFRIPFFDSAVGAGLTVTDSWDRRLACADLPLLVPTIRYRGAAPQLASAQCDATSGLATLTLSEKLHWWADVLARFAHGQIEVWMRNPQVEQFEWSASAGLPFLQPGGTWGTVIVPPPSQEAQGLLVGGTLTAGGFMARIDSFRSTSSSELVCVFEANAQCAGEQLFDMLGATSVVLRESDGSEKLWVPAGEIDLNADGSPSRMVLSTPMSRFVKPTHSTTYWFATSVGLTYQGQRYRSRIGPSVACNYIHPPPEMQQRCYAVTQLGSDYYGRAYVKVEPLGCDALDTSLEIGVVGAAQRVESPEEMSRVGEAGVFGPQVPHWQRTVFQGFNALASARDGSDFTLGLSVRRPADGSESKPSIAVFTARKGE